MPSPVFVISGCSSGFGRELVHGSVVRFTLALQIILTPYTASAALSRGYRVIATARKPEAIADLASDNCKTLQLDVTKSESDLADFAKQAIAAL